MAAFRLTISRLVALRAWAAAVLVTSAAVPCSGQEREPHGVRLPTLLPYFEDKTGRLDEVFITWGSRKEGFAIGDIDDRFIRDTKRMSLEHLHKEYPAQARLMTEFEAEQLSTVCHAFGRTLNGLEGDLHRKRWGRALYLDGHLSFFLRGFYYLFTAVYCNRRALPAAAFVADSLWDEDINSPKSDRRIAQWQADPERVIKLRVSIHELVHQIEQWQEKELTNKRRDPWKDGSRDFVKAYELFVKLYFGTG